MQTFKSVFVKIIIRQKSLFLTDGFVYLIEKFVYMQHAFNDFCLLCAFYDIVFILHNRISINKL